MSVNSVATSKHHASRRGINNGHHIVKKLFQNYKKFKKLFTSFYRSSFFIYYILI
jgi:succinate dehydrogenase/fumarate reductase flavoprotein subunit